MVDQTSATSARSSIAERLTAARERRFVGRADEVELFRSALSVAEPSFAVLYVYGPGGVGKTTLLSAYQREADGSGATCLRLDGRAIEPSPAGLLRAIADALGIPPDRSPLQALGMHERVVVLLDTYERLTPIDDWLRETFLPQLPANSITVIAGRNPPAVGWRDDSGWSELLSILPLRNLRPEECREYLRARHVPLEQQPGMLAFTHGHPLALSLVADLLAQPNMNGTPPPVDDPDVVRVLLERFVEGVPDRRHREALEVCAHVRVTTEALLAEALETDDAHELFDWLRDLSFIEHGPHGIFPHDLARDVLDADLRWRNPDDYRDLHQRVRRHFTRGIQNARGLEQHHAFFDLLFLHRNSPIMRPFYEWSLVGSGYVEPATPADLPVMVEDVDKFLGPQSADIARYWAERQPQSFHAFRNGGGELIGFTCMLVLDEVTDEDRASDPAIPAAAGFAQRYGPIRPGETLLYCRFALSCASGLIRDASSVWDLVSVVNVTHWATTQRLAWSFIAVNDLDHWRTFFHYIRQPHVPDAGFVTDSQSQHVFAHDWRAEPLVAWLDLMHERELATDLTPAQLDTPAPTPLVVLSEPAFEEAVRRALRDYARPDTLATNPLMRSRLVADAAGETPTAETLRELIRLATERLTTNPRDERLYRAINRTYLSPASTQEQAAELLGIPFSTYRSHLTAAIDRITTWLWQRELYGPE